jgi:2,5-furandicarboxylate decarboxylase 1
MATRFQGDEDLVMIRNMMGSELDPSVKVGNLSTKIGFDCTKPAPPQKYEKRVQISREVLERVRKAGFLTDDEIKKLV